MDYQQTTVPDCLMCAVRQLTEGEPEEGWHPDLGDTVSGAVLRVGHHATPFGGMVPFVDLWLGGFRRVRVIAYSTVLARKLMDQELKVGDRVRIAYIGRKPIERGRHAGREVRDFSVMVERGHH